MDVISDSSSIFGAVVRSEDGELVSLAHGHLQQIRHEVVGDAVGVLACNGLLNAKESVGGVFFLLRIMNININFPNRKAYSRWISCIALIIVISCCKYLIVVEVLEEIDYILVG